MLLPAKYGLRVLSIRSWVSPLFYFILFSHDCVGPGNPGDQDPSKYNSCLNHTNIDECCSRYRVSPDVLPKRPPSDSLARPMAFLDDLAANASAHNMKIVIYSGNDDSLVPHRGSEGLLIH